MQYDTKQLAKENYFYQSPAKVGYILLALDVSMRNSIYYSDGTYELLSALNVKEVYDALTEIKSDIDTTIEMHADLYGHRLVNFILENDHNEAFFIDFKILLHDVQMNLHSSNKDSIQQYVSRFKQMYLSWIDALDDKDSGLAILKFKH